MKHTTLTSMKFLRLKRRLNRPAWQVAGVLEMLWSFAATNCHDGAVGRFSNEDLASWMEWSDSADELISTLLECGWLDKCETNRLKIHDWNDHCPTWIKGVQARTKLPTKLPTKSGTKCETKSVTKDGTNSSQLPNLTKPNLTKLRHPSPDGEGSSAPVSTNALAATEPDILTFPCAKGKRTADESWGLKSKQVSDWQSAFPGVQVLAECKKALAWVMANPAHKKTASGMPEFLYRWLAKVNDRRPPGSSFAGPASVRDQRRAEDTAATARVLSGGPISPAVDGLLADYQAVQELKKARADPNPDLGGDRSAESKPGPFPGIPAGGGIFE